MQKTSTAAALGELPPDKKTSSRRRFIRAAGTRSLSGVVGTPPVCASAPGEGVFELEDLVLQTGATVREAKLAYKTHGRLNADKSNAIVYPTPYSAHHSDIEWPIGPGKALDPQRYFIIVPDMLGNGLSSSPSNTPQPYDRARFPNVTVYDNVVAQHRLVTEGFGISRVALVVGWSMGAQQTFQWAASHPEMVERIAPFCGTARTTPHNLVFLEGIKAALTADAAWTEGWYEKQPARGIRAFARVYAGWGFSQPFYKQELYRQLGFSSLEDFLIGFWERRFLRRDANDLLAMLWTWQHNDLGSTPGCGGSLEHALGSIRAKALVMTGQTDLYFTPEDIQYEASHIPDASFRVIPSVWGHQAGNGLNPDDSRFIDEALKGLLAA
ncbi:MAG TPA: alpha/beta fold hydrolase [Burkholderiales bacterium]|nr:alpha/beta fold hydrolase [Burkholderiales bacterium]